jgi:hypothetical protein
VRFPINTRILYTFLSALIIIVGSIVAIQFAQGYRFSRKGNLQGNGLLVANSFPAGAEIYVNEKFYGATDDTLYIEPGDYTVEIRKDGYTPWKKQLKVESELVNQTNAQLFRQVPGLTPLTFAGVKNVSPSPDGQRVLFYTASASSQLKNGLYILELSGNLLTSTREARQIADDAPEFKLESANYTWSPDNSEVILSSNGHEVLLDLSRKNNLSSLPDITLRKKQLLSEWEAELYIRERQYMEKFPAEMIKIATTSATNVYLSPDKKKLLYTATASATLPPDLIPPLPASNTQPEMRTLQPGGLYVYDREEDKNFLLSIPNPPSATASGVAKILLATDLYNREPKTLAASPSGFRNLQASTSAQVAHNFRSYYSSLYTHGAQWFPDSTHILFTENDKIYLIEYDNTNKTPVYAGPFRNEFVYPWPDGSKLVILTSFSANLPMNLYAIELK